MEGEKEGEGLELYLPSPLKCAITNFCQPSWES